MIFYLWLSIQVASGPQTSREDSARRPRPPARWLGSRCRDRDRRGRPDRARASRSAPGRRERAGRAAPARHSESAQPRVSAGSRGACRARGPGSRHVLVLARADVRARPVRHPRDAAGDGDRPVRGDAARGVHGRLRIPLPAPWRGRPALRRAGRHEPRPDRGRGGGGHSPDAAARALHLRRLRRPARRAPPGALRLHVGANTSRSPTAWSGASTGRSGSGRPFTACGPWTPRAWAPCSRTAHASRQGARCTSTSPSSRPRWRSARPGRAAARSSGCSATACRRRTGASCTRRT